MNDTFINVINNTNVFKNCKQIKAYKNRLKLRKRIDEVTKRPKAPHNTTTFIINSNKANSKTYGKDDKDQSEQIITIEDFIITGGSMKGIFLIK